MNLLEAMREAGRKFDEYERNDHRIVDVLLSREYKIRDFFKNKENSFSSKEDILGYLYYMLFANSDSLLISINYPTESITTNICYIEDYLADDWILVDSNNLHQTIRDLFTDLELRSFFIEDISKEKKSESEVQIIPDGRFLCGNCNVIFDGIVTLDKKDNKYICPYCGYDIFTQLCTLRISKEGI